ncbi:MAG: sulfite exporter TauE/SafE family protein [Nitrospirae bacterium]|nr:sulfite exporter TauE/SafE family protein [Nitrospirota bacterium]
MHFPVSGVDVNPLVLPLVSFVISFFTSMGGLSGAFLLLPFQVSVLGFNAPAVSATNHLFNVVAIPGGVYRYMREGRMVWPLAIVVVAGTLPGVLVGTLIRVKYLPDPKDFKLFVGLVLFYIGIRLLKDILGGSKIPKPQAEMTAVTITHYGFRKVGYEFQGRTYKVNSIGIMALSLVVGIIGGVYGIGGGAIIAPFFVSIFGLPVYTVAGAALMGTFTTSLAAVFIYQLIGGYFQGTAIAPDWMLGILFGVGGFAGIYCGARFQKRVPAKVIKWILVFCVMIPALSYILDFAAAR